MTITGSNFTGATAVSFGGNAASFSVVSATSITATSPAHAAGAVDIMVTTPSGTSVASAADTFTYAALPPPPTGYLLCGTDICTTDSGDRLLAQ